MPMARDDFYASVLGAVYSFYMEHPRIGLPIGRLAWGGDFAPYYKSMAAVSEAPPGSTVVDCPCGAGPAFRALDPRADLRYVAVDLSPSMLARARRSAAARGVAVEFLAADAAALPLPDGAASTLLSFWGLHCFEHPRTAVAEAARVLEPRGRLVGATFLRGRETLRQRFFIRPHVGGFGPIGTGPEVEDWLQSSGFEEIEMTRSGPMLFFSARRA